MAVTGRYAPSPTGRMHLGNALTALLSWLSARSKDGRWILRIEDLDPQRSRPEYISVLEDDLKRLGLVWDEGGSSACSGLYCQSRRSAYYVEAMQRLNLQGLTYPCFCSRADILAASAPHESDGRVVYPGTCRNLSTQERMKRLMGEGASAHSVRVMVPDKEISFEDGVFGHNSVNLARECGDFIIRRSDGVFAYQLAVVVDDALMGVTEVVRGRDLLLSASQQIFLFETLGYAVPQFSHIPLLCSSDGQRLCKRDKSLDMGSLFEQYYPEQIIGRLAHYAGMIPYPEPCRAEELIPLYSTARIPREDIRL